MNDSMLRADEGMALPSRLGPYLVQEVLGRGGMGIVYRGLHVDSGRAVAIKTVSTIAPRLLSALRAEVQALKRVRHIGVIRVVDEGLSDELPWYAMECLEGQTLASFNAQIWRNKPLTERAACDFVGSTDRDSVRLKMAPVEEARDIARESPAGGELHRALTFYRGICGALDHIHRGGLVHRDLKPSNVFLSGGTTPILMDFGLAGRSSGGQGREALASSWHGRQDGTLPYVSPEQLRGELVDARADLYGLGCMLYETLAGRPPFSASTVSGYVRAHLDEHPVPPSHYLAGLPDELDVLVLRLLAKSPHERIGRADDVDVVLASVCDPTLAVGSRESFAQPYLYRPRLTGRSDLLANIDERRIAAKSGRGSLLLIAGESGVGKTFLASEAAQRAASDNICVLTGECQPPTGEQEGELGRTPFGALRHLLQYVTDRCREGDETTTARLLGERCRVLANYEPSLAYVPGQGTYPDPPTLDPVPARSRILRAMADTIDALSRDTPVVVVLDDLQWADELTLDLLALLTQEVTRMPVLVLGTFRNDESAPSLQRLIDTTGAHQVALPPLDKPTIARLVADMLAIETAPPALLDLVSQLSEGNPFFAAEYLRLAVSEGLLQRRSGEWVLSERMTNHDSTVSLPLPRSIHDLVSRRLASLDPLACSLIETAAVLGREFDADLLGALIGAQDLVFDGIEPLRRLQILQQTGENTFRFVHDRLREAVYASLPLARRRALHTQAARTLELRQTWRPSATASYPLIAYHWANAGQHRSAARYLMRSASGARAAYANEDAKRFYASAIDNFSRARADAGAAPPQLSAEITALEQLGDLLMLTGLPGEAKERYEGALELVADADQRARFERKIGRSWAARHRHQEALQTFERAEASIRSVLTRDKANSVIHWREWVEIRNDRIWSCYWTGERAALSALVAEQRPVVELFGAPLQQANFFRALCLADLRHHRYRIEASTLTHARGAYAAATASENFAEIASTRFNLGFVLMAGGMEDEAASHMAQVVAAAEKLGDRGLQVRALAYHSVIARLRNQTHEAHESAEKTRLLAVTGGMPHYLGIAYASLGWAEYRREGFGSALELLRKALEIWRAEPPTYPLQWLAVWPLIELLARQNDLAEAIQLARSLLQENQQRLADTVEYRLKELEKDASKPQLHHAIRAARAAGYL